MENLTVSKITEDIQETFDALEKIISDTEENQINTIPSDGSWSVGQTAEHILLSAGGFSHTCKENTQNSDRDFDEKIPFIKSLFLDFTTKMKSPENILPIEKKHNKESILENLESIKNEMILAANNWDLSLTCMNFEFPGMGYLTRLEWIYFLLFHTQRHTFQIQNTLLKI